MLHIARLEDLEAQVQAGRVVLGVGQRERAELVVVHVVEEYFVEDGVAAHVEELEALLVLHLHAEVHCVAARVVGLRLQLVLHLLQDFPRVFVDFDDREGQLLFRRHRDALASWRYL